jgi:uncharacterized protein YcnI
MSLRFRQSIQRRTEAVNTHPIPRRSAARSGVALAAAIALIAPAAASAHARISPPVSLANQLQLYSLAVPTEKSSVKTTKIVLTVPDGFSIDSFVPSPGWQRVEQTTGAGNNAVIQKVTWTGGKVPSGEDSLFQFLGQPASSKKYTFTVQQTYSDGSIVDWSGSGSSDAPAPTIKATSSLGGGGGSTLALIALVVGAVGILLGGLALVSKSGRPLA